MNKKETVLLFGLIAALFPRDDKFAKCDELMRDAWAEMLADIPFDHAKAAVKAAVATSPFPPSISEIREYATRITAPKRLTADEAWGIACEAMRTYGLNTVLKDGFVPHPVTVREISDGCRVYKVVSHQPSGLEYEAKRHVPPEVWALMERMGYRDMFMSDNPDVVRGQFMRAWGKHDREATERRVLGGVLPEFVRMLSETMGGGLLDEGGKA